MTHELSKDDIAAINDLKPGYTLGHADVAILKSAAALLAAHEQEPVAWMTTREGDSTFPRLHIEEGSADYWVDYCNVAPPVYKHRLFTASSIPAIVPEPEFWVATDIDGDWYFCNQGHPGAVALCRAAMLHHSGDVTDKDEPVSKPYKLPEGIPERIWLNTAGEWPADGSEGEVTWCRDQQHELDTMYVRAGAWIPVSERLPDPESADRVCVYTPTPHEDIRYRFVPASLFKVVCRDATHWQYMTPPLATKAWDC